MCEYLSVSRRTVYRYDAARAGSRRLRNGSGAKGGGVWILNGGRDEMNIIRRATLRSRRRREVP